MNDSVRIQINWQHTKNRNQIVWRMPRYSDAVSSAYCQCRFYALHFVAVDFVGRDYVDPIDNGSDADGTLVRALFAHKRCSVVFNPVVVGEITDDDSIDVERLKD